jgi:hypothetical protein
MSNQFVVRKGLKVLEVPTGSTSNQAIFYNTSTNEIETRDSDKSGIVSSGFFTGTPKTYTVSFNSPFPNTNYSAIITGGDARAWTVENLTVNGFTINSNSNTSLTYSTYWVAVLNT